MTDRIYSLYEAKAKFSQILKAVREGQTVTVSYHGEPVAEIRPIAGKPGDLAGRIRRLTERGVVLPARGPVGRLRPIARKPGGLKRFLDERSE